jgi:RNA polymerase sigma factor (sigma-70 family)
MLDPALCGFVDARTEDEADERLSSLFELQISPLVRRVVSRRLSAHGARYPFEAQDIGDVVGDAVVVLVKRLQALRAQSPSADIESLEDYTAAVAHSACAHYLRGRYPERTRLKNRLRYLLGRDRRFAVWDTADAGLCCGFSRWQGTGRNRSASEQFAAIEREPERWRSPRPASVDDADPVPLVARIFEAVNGPVEFDRLVGVIGAIWQIDRGRPGPPELEARETNPELEIDRRRFAERLWAEVVQLPVRQRAALLLNLRDCRGSGVLWLLPATGVASMRAIARALEMPPEELAVLWRSLPIDDRAIAERLGCERQQVINLRMSARKRLGIRLATPAPPTATAAPALANLRDVSASVSTEK